MNTADPINVSYSDIAPVDQIEELAKNSIEKYQEVKGKVREAQQMLRDNLESDTMYSQAKKTAAGAKKEQDARKETLLMNGTYAEMQAKIDELKEELNESKELLAAALFTYKKRTGKSAIKISDDEVYKIENKMTVVPTRQLSLL